MTVVDKLKKSWSLVSRFDKDLFKNVDSLTCNNFRDYRKLIVDPTEPCIPYHSLILQDLSYIEEMETQFENKDINFEKLEVLSKTLENIILCKSYVYIFEEDPEIQQFIHHRKICNEEELSTYCTKLLELESKDSEENSKDKETKELKKKDDKKKLDKKTKKRVKGIGKKKER